jgi:hypothetical protein
MSPLGTLVQQRRQGAVLDQIYGKEVSDLIAVIDMVLCKT